MENLKPDQLAAFTPLKSKLTNVTTKIKAITDQGRLIAADNSQLFLFKGMYKELKPYFDTFNDTWDKLTELVASWNVTNVFPLPADKTLQSNMERYYYESCAIYEKHMNPTPVLPTDGAAHSRSFLNESRLVRARLPHINLPNFDGTQKDWPLFRDTYTALIHDETTLSGIEKFLFLVSCLKGPALALIKGIELQEANYPQAWKVLTTTYNDKRRLANNYLTTVLEFTPFRSRPSASNLKTLLTTVGESVDSFKQLKIPNAEDFILFNLVLRCLDTETRRAFEKKYCDTEFPTYKNLIDFITVEWRSLELTLEGINHTQGKPNGNQVGKPLLSAKGSRTHSSLFAGNRAPKLGNQPDAKLRCPVCKSSHTLYQCVQFKQASPKHRLTLLKEWQGCTNCLSSKHSKNQCPSQRRCQSCSQNHHTWLHIQCEPDDAHKQNHQSNSSTSGIVLGSSQEGNEVLLGTALIEIKNANGSMIQIRAVLDSGSQHSFITEHCAAQLGLPTKPCKQRISGIGQQQLKGASGKLECTIQPVTASGVSTRFHVDPIIVPRITHDLPHTTISPTIQALYKSYVLADPEFWKPGSVDFLLGGGTFYDVITGRPVTIDINAPRLLPTKFGYVVGGPLKDTPAPEQTSSLLVQSSEEIKDVLTKFWEMEEVFTKPILSEESEICESHFASTHSRLDNGRYVVSLPLKDSVNTLTNPRQQALSRLLNLEVKLAKDAWLKEEYHKFMKEYLTLGHMRLAPPDTSAYTIPHHAVLKDHNGSSKLRVVFDASCQTRNGSLNDHMYAGPKLQKEIGDVITNFRVPQFVFTADIVKMYRQILLTPRDRRYQHILWRFNSTDVVQEFELCTVTYGEKASPFLAQRTLKQLVNDEGPTYPLAAKALLEDVYVDDIVTGAQSVPQLIQLRNQLIALLGKGGFQLSKWASNCPALLNDLNDIELGEARINLSDEPDSRLKVLGIQWNPKEDVFSYQIVTPPFNPTKRAILSSIARIYDPLGFLSPVVFYAKTILQELWMAHTGWDDIGPPDVCDKWKLFLHQLDHISQVQIPRYLHSAESVRFQLIGFSDVSQRGYSAVLYLQAEAATGVHVSLLKAKTKLAPIKPTTIPRLELAGASLLSRLYQSSQTLTNKLNIADVHLFTDSQIVLGWLATPPENLKTFVAHRVVEMLDITDKHNWKFVPSKDNPADCSSRGLLPAELITHPLWWHGPSWLSMPSFSWPISVSDSPTALPEMKNTSAIALHVNEDQDSPILGWMQRFSSYLKLVRSTAYAARFIASLTHRPITNGPISVVEYRHAEKLLLRIVQREYKTMDGTLIDAKSLRSLRPFIDPDGFVRVGGRLQHSNLPHDAKHPYLLPADSQFTKLLIDYYHVAYLHLAPSALKTMLQTRYWIIGARGLIRRRIFNCIKCYKAMRSPQVPIMGNLPSCRVQEGQVFAFVGVDFAGPFSIRESLRRKASLGKAYLCLFVCMTTKAVHLEVVSKCSTDAFLAAFERFISRKGKPIHVYSDCGTNFVGAANRLREIILHMRSKETQEKIINHVVPHEIEWSFNPPSAPHFGGLWEAGVKSCKTILYKIIGESSLTFEELTTLFCQIEGILNSRPLATLENDPDNVECITPGHFLIGRPLTALPGQAVIGNISTLQRWRLVQQKAQHFWSRWRMEYLNQLQQRKKWTKERRNCCIGDIVIIKEPNSSMKTWPLARIIDTHAGPDGVVRVVTIRTQTGTYKRPVSKLVPLDPVNECSVQ